MLDRLKETVTFIEQLNDKTGILSGEEIEEQYENLQDFDKLSGEFKALLDDFKTVHTNHGDEVEKKLFELHRILTTFEWHFSEISDLNTKILKEYKDRVNHQ